MGSRKRITVVFGKNDNSTVNGRTCPTVVCVPPYRTFFVGEVQGVREGLAGTYWALSNVLRPVRPWVPGLLQSMPVKSDVVSSVVVSFDDNGIASVHA